MTAESANEKARSQQEGRFIPRKKKHQEIKRSRWVERWSRQEEVRVQERQKNRTCD